MKLLYNEGRSVGLSAYELYVRELLAEGVPQEDIPSEKAWIQLTMGNSSSLLIKIPVSGAANTPFVMNIPLPSGTNLRAPHTVRGSFFLGDCETDSQGWATKVTNYGTVISNTSSLHPSTTSDASQYPSIMAGDLSDIQLKQLGQYLKIQDGAILQAGTWTDTASGNPAKDLSPQLSNIPVLRLVFTSNVTTPFCLLLTGFEDITKAESSALDGSTDSPNPENGDFLGPAVYPWTTKIEFANPPTALYNAFVKSTSDNNFLSISKNNDSAGFHYSLGVLPLANGGTGGNTKPTALTGLGLTPNASTQTIGSNTKPIYLSGGTITAFSQTIGSNSQPVYVNGGTISPISQTIGSTAVPVYIKNGVITTASRFDINQDTIQTITLYAGNWAAVIIGANTMYRQTIAVSGVTTTTVQDIFPVPCVNQATYNMHTAYIDAEMQDGGQSNGNITLVCLNKPTIDIQLHVVVRGV